jgi:NAD(P)-dependent dehydrogenase (short-subunit alcohol dehydrogenase family)
MKTVLITGSARGIGYEFVRQYLSKGWKVIATVRDRRLYGSLSDISNPNLKIYQMNVTHTNEIYEVSTQIGDSLDLLINNAGIGAWTGSLTKGNYQEYLDILSVNSLGPLFVVRGFVEQLTKSRGTVVNLTSGMGLLSTAKGDTSIPYRMSKCALHMASISMKNFLYKRGVNVLILDPGWVKTELGGPKAHIPVSTSVLGMIDVIEKNPEFGNYLYNGDKLSLY